MEVERKRVSVKRCRSVFSHVKLIETVSRGDYCIDQYRNNGKGWRREGEDEKVRGRVRRNITWNPQDLPQATNVNGRIKQSFSYS